jgi:hypothetical protein
MRNTQVKSEPKEKDHEKKIYTQEEIDLIEEKYKDKELKMQKFVSEPANPLLDQYRQHLLQQPVFQKESIIYDQTTGKWKLVKENP